MHVLAGLLAVLVMAAFLVGLSRLTGTGPRQRAQRRASKRSAERAAEVARALGLAAERDPESPTTHCLRTSGETGDVSLWMGSPALFAGMFQADRTAPSFAGRLLGERP